ncbi:MAG: prephenate dehydrogenase/arogenate dehydrogenase family protein [Alphaproteobacteria bacterium]|nr:prephenate dehydrogenase/arogenate dehydrogenase family protein [Alphaproteobacteria bacterium]MBU1515747.1 prephenate dehydrogenase/arogenate dehydrogenase family protein [Alphaproteobacteria bacterium]MBU2097030.1 prephenate dehydrogenase/arogenate dehydrogenase family protein [Alphaproteobacteria bacterium]MBU2149546.1 prephenate dehydrogenase/arogenate dehydrogenase family protein [Alphaproteobacteria bacterium]MBU2308932.1 prephenate dehydrogenase/arogenate dehydrogenase family protein 
MKRLGLIGFGQFGQLAAGVLKDHFDVLVSDVAPDAAARAEALGVGFGPLEAAAACEIVVVAVPVVAMRAVFAAIAPSLSPGALLVDVGSVKVLPTQWMLELLPAHVDIVATHPLFGPQSARTGLAGLRFVVCQVRSDRHERVAEFGRSLGLAVTIATPEEHDEEMAYVQALTHLIGRSLVNLGIPDERLATQSYQHLLELCGLIGNDSFELFTAIQTQNPFAPKVVAAFVREAESLLEQIGSRTAT